MSCGEEGEEVDGYRGDAHCEYGIDRFWTILQVWPMPLEPTASFGPLGRNLRLYGSSVVVELPRNRLMLVEGIVVHNQDSLSPVGNSDLF